MKTKPEQNRLLALLSDQSKERVFPLLREIELPLDKDINASAREVKSVYFPVDCIISLFYLTLDGHSAEVAVVGREGVIGITAFMSGRCMPSQAIVQSAGSAYCLPASEIKREFDNNAATRMLMLCYTQSLINQMSLTVVCNRHHTIGQQLCRFLLLSLDRLPTNELKLTQELIARMLGVRREGVTEAARQLQKLGVIQYRRGHITVLDRRRLERRCCECYAAVNEHAEPIAV